MKITLPKSKANAHQLRQCFYYLFGTMLLLVTATKTVKAQVAGPTLTVDVGGNRHPISSNIYGMNQYAIDPSLAQELKLPVVRWGGDNTTRYNWKADSTNTGADWYFVSGNGQANPTPSGQTDKLISTDKANGSNTIITIPIIGYINNSAATSCSFPVHGFGSMPGYGPQQSVNPYVHPYGDSCGNGVHTDGSKIADIKPLGNNMTVDPPFMQGWIQHLIGTFGTASLGGVKFYEMDNEPSGWGNTHRDVHPGATSYDDIRDLTYAYAGMVKKTDPNAQVLGPSDFGWPVYVGSNSDLQKHNNLWDAPWYLQQMQMYQQQHGARILDYFDEHYYPTGPGDDLWRLRSTRSLWDQTYKDESWIGQWYGAVMLIPRMKQWVNQYYPGTKTAITEYNWGALNRLNGALAQADVLGIFGREGLDLATLWGPPKSSDPGAYAFRMYLNYDGQGDKFGDTSISSVSTDQGQLAIYGAQRSSDQALTLIIINKTGNNLSSALALKGFSPPTSASVYTYSGNNLSAIVSSKIPVTSNGFSYTYPANSISLVVIP